MLSKKPEYIDPEEKNITYYSYRNKSRKSLTENDGCCSKRRSVLVFKSTRGRLFMVALYLILVLYLFMMAHKRRAGSKIGAEAVWEQAKLRLSAYMLPESNWVQVQLFYRNTDEDKQITVPKAETAITLSNDEKSEKKIFILPETPLSPNGLGKNRWKLEVTEKYHTVLLEIKLKDKILKMRTRLK